MNHQENQNIALQKTFLNKGKKIFLLVNFFLIIFSYHILRDLKDTLIVTSCEAGAKMIPFIKIWFMLPFAFLCSYIFQKLYHRFGRDKTFYILVGSLVFFYLAFAFCLYPNRESLHLNGFTDWLEKLLPSSFSGLTNMIRFWSFSLFYSFAEMWSILVISVLFWSTINEITPTNVAKYFFPTCIMMGNIAGVVSGQISYFIGHYLCKNKTWEESMQMMILAVLGAALIMVHNHYRVFHGVPELIKKKEKKETLAFLESLQNVLRKPQLLCIVVLVVGFAFTSNLFEVVWKNSIKAVYSTPSDYNSYMNQITTMIGLLSLVFSFLMQYLFKFLKQSSILLMTPIALLITGSLFFTFLEVPAAAKFFQMPYANFIVLFGSIHYILTLSAKYSLFDTSKEIAFLAINPEERIKAKSIIDSVGSRIGKSGSSLFQQLLLILFATSGAYTSLIGCISILCMIGILISAKKLGAFSKEAPLEAT